MTDATPGDEFEGTQTLTWGWRLPEDTLQGGYTSPVHVLTCGPVTVEGSSPAEALANLALAVRHRRRSWGHP